MKSIKVATLGKDNKVAYNAAGEQFFVPEPLRTAITTASFAIVISKSFTSKTDDVEGSPTYGKVIPCDEWTRQQLSFIGTKDEVLQAKAESTLLDREESAFIAQETKKLESKYKVEDMQPA